jgi:RNA polymerase sigma-70 factor (ECF subfamily)
MDSVMEQAVVREWAAGNALAGELLVRRYAPFVYNLCLRMLRSEHAAEDATQDTFVNAWRNREKLAEVREVKRWLCTVATNVCLNLIRRDRHAASPVALPDVDDVPDPGPFPLPVGAERSTLLEAIDALPDLTRMALICRVHLELSNRDASEILGVSPEAYRVLVHRGLKSLRARLAKKETA